MFERLAADSVVVIHFAFILFVIAGGLLVFRWRWVMLLHLPAVAWGALIEFSGGICPLTPLEQSLRTAAGQAGYQGGFIDHYLMPVIYPPELSRTLQIGMGVFVVLLNATIYFLLLRRLNSRKKHTDQAADFNAKGQEK